MLCALIMAGGKGERFWPLSTEEKPKQFLSLLKKETMIQMTVKRLENLIPVDRIFIVTGKRYVNLVKEQLPMIPDRNIIIEPVGKNTAPCIGLSAFIIDKYYKDATIAVLPSDHLIKHEEKFRDNLKVAFSFVEDNKDAIVTLGMKPNRPETGYGYIKYSNIITRLNSKEIRSVDKFVEKPSLETAKKYLEDGNFLWNGGMFIWKATTILKLTKKYLNDTYEILSEIAVAKDEDFNKILDAKYRNVESISVDYGIMEKAKNIYVIPSEFGWDDLGSWSSIERYKDKDETENVINKDCIFYKSKGNIVISDKKVILNNIENLIVVETDDCIMISTKKDEQEIKNAKNLLNQ